VLGASATTIKSNWAQCPSKSEGTIFLTHSFQLVAGNRTSRTLAEARGRLGRMMTQVVTPSV
jgi:hypothetical protein